MWEDDWYTWSLTPSRRTNQTPFGFGMIGFNDLFDRLEKMLSEAAVERRRTLTLTVTEGDNNSIDRAIEMLQDMKVSKEDSPEEESSVETTSDKENFNEDFKEDHA